MRCSKCKKEFGSGDQCLNCGIDKYIGLGNYAGYSVPDGIIEESGSNLNMNGVPDISVDSNSMVCYNCTEIIPADSKFCPVCREFLWVKCPNCGKRYSS